MRIRNFLLAVVIASTAGVQAQQAPINPNPSQNRPGWSLSGSGRVDWVSPDVHPDRTITFRISAPEAASVKLNFANKAVPMTKDDKGVWSASVGPVEPDIYNFSYQIGGARVNNGQVEVPGNPPRYDELQGVPHGAIVLQTYNSKVQGRERHLRVYLPPQYFNEPSRKFPVLYLFNGSDEVEWTTEGKVDIVLDNLIAQKKAVPMIIVMPNNRIHGEDIAQTAAFAAKAKNPEERAGLASSADTVAVMEKELPTDIMPMIEKDYRTYNDRAHRAIAGLSFGGGTAFGVGMRHLDWFDYVGEFGTGTFGGLDNPTDGYVSYMIPYDPEKIAPGIYKNLKDPAVKPKLFYMSVGAQDPRRTFQEKAYQDFKAHGDDVVFETYPGAHEFKFFRRAMADYVTRIFL